LQGERSLLSVPTLPFSLTLTGNVDIAAVRRSFGELFRRHEILRTGFPDPRRWSIAVEDAVLDALVRHDVPGGGALTQTVWPEALSHLLASQAISVVEGALTTTVRHELSRPFDISRPPLIRGVLRRRRPGVYQLLLMLHHLIGDGFSLRILRDDIQRLYVRELGMSDPSLGVGLMMQYGDFAETQWLEFGSHREEHVVPSWNEARGYAFDPRWLGRRAAGRIDSTRGIRQLRLPGRLVCDLTQNLLPKQRLTLYIALVAAISVAISAKISRHKIGILSLCANRTSTEAERLIGWCANIGLLCLDVDGEESIAALLRRVKGQVVQALRSQSVPLQAIWQGREVTQLFRMGNFIACDVVTHGEPATVGTMTVSSTPYPWRDRPRAVPFRIRLHQFVERFAPDELVLECEYYPAFNDPTTIDDLLQAIAGALELMSEDPYLRVASLVARLTQFDRRPRDGGNGRRPPKLCPRASTERHSRRRVL